MVIQDNAKEIKQLNQGGRKSIDMDDLLLKNFRKFNDLYEIKLILPKWKHKFRDDNIVYEQ